MLSRPFLGRCGLLIVHTCKGCNENEYMSIGWRQQFPHWRIRSCSRGPQAAQCAAARWDV